MHSIGGSRDRIIDQPGDGVDTASVYIATYTLPDNVENLTVAYTGGGTYHGNAFAFGGGLAAGQQPTLVTVEDRHDAPPSHTGTFIFDNAGADAGTLYWDADGGKLKDATVIAHLTGVTSLTPSDFHIV